MYRNKNGTQLNFELRACLLGERRIPAHAEVFNVLRMRILIIGMLQRKEQSMKSFPRHPKNTTKIVLKSFVSTIIFSSKSPALIRWL